MTADQALPPATEQKAVAPAQEAAQTVQWPDFRAFDPALRLRVIPLASQRRALLFEGGNKYPERMQKMGFMRSSAGSWFRPETKITAQDIASWRTLFTLPGGAPGVEMRWQPIASIIFKPKPKEGPNIDTLMAQSRRLGFNAGGSEVFEGVDGRFAVNPQTRSIQRELKDDGTPSSLSPSVFLRAPDVEELDGCIAGIIHSLQSGEIIGTEALAEFRASSGSDAVVPPATLLAKIEDAVTRMAIRAGASPYESYVLASSLAGRLQASTAWSGALAPHLAIALRRAFVAQDIADGKLKVSAPAGFASMLFDLPHVKAFDADFTEEAAARLSAAVGVVPLTTKIDGAPDFTMTWFSGEPVEGEPFSPAWAPLDLLERAPHGRSLIVIPASADAESLDKAMADIDAGWHVEAIGSLDGNLVGQGIGTDAYILLAVNARRIEPHVSELGAWRQQTKRLDSPETLWGWTDDVIRARAKLRPIADMVRSRSQSGQAPGDTPAEAIEGDEEARRKTEPLQVPCVTAARREGLGTSEAMIPRFLEAPYLAALSDLVRQHGDVVTFVANQLAMEEDELISVLGAEQVDGVALWISARLRGEAIVFGDMTGLGKGRQLAAAMRWSLLRNEPVVFMTAQNKLFSDIMRDLQAFKSDHLINPLNITGSDVYEDGTTNVLFRSPHKRYLDHVFESGELPEGANFVLATYSQISRPQRRCVKARFMHKIAGTSHLVTDEAHKAAGTSSHIGNNMNLIVGEARHVTYSSATWAKTPTNMPVYRRAFPTAWRGLDVITLVRRGGPMAQEAMIASMARAGNLVRREINMAGLNFFSWEDSTRRARNWGYAEQLAPVLVALNNLGSGIARARAEERNRRLIEEGGEQLEVLGRDAMQVATFSFGSPHYLLSSLLRLAINADGVSDLACEALARNEKPIIVIEHTAAQYLNDAVQEVDGIEIQTTPDFKHAVRAVLRRMRRDIGALEEQGDLGEGANSVDRMISLLPDMPLTPIDTVKARLRAIGASVGEITGRTKEFRDGAIRPREAASMQEECVRFQDGDHDAMVLGKPGFAGISLHASAVVQDQRKRALIFFEPPADVADMMQALGRANRRDQIMPPDVYWVSSGLPGDVRFDIMLESKLRHLSANCTSNRTSVASRKDIPDLYNSVGTEAVMDFLDANRDIARILGFGDFVDARAEARAKGFDLSNDDINDALGMNARTLPHRIISYANLIHPDQAERMLESIFASFEARLAELDAINANPLRNKELEGVWEVKSTELYQAAPQVHGLNQNIMVSEIEGVVPVVPLRSGDVMRVMEMGIRPGYQIPGYTQNNHRVTQEFRDRQSALLEARILRLRADGKNEADINTVVVSHRRISGWLVPDERGKMALSVGAAITLKHFDRDEIVTGVVTEIELPPSEFSLNLGFYRIGFAIPGERKTFNFSIASLLVDPAFEIQAVSRERQAEILATFDAVVDATQIKRNRVLQCEDLLRLLALRLRRTKEEGQRIGKAIGQMAIFRDKSGLSHRAMILPDFQAEAILHNMPVSMPDADTTIALLMGGEGAKVGIFSDQGMRPNKGISVVNTGQKIVISIPRATEAPEGFYDNPTILGMTKGKVPSRRTSVKIEGEEGLRTFLEACSRVNVTFYARALYRDWLNARMVIAMAEKAEAIEGEKLPDIPEWLTSEEIEVTTVAFAMAAE